MVVCDLMNDWWWCVVVLMVDNHKFVWIGYSVV